MAEYFRITWRSVRRIVDRVVDEQREEEKCLDGLRMIGVDEISYRKRHKYLTVVVDHLRGRVVWAGQDRKAKTLLKFFRKLGAQRTSELEAVSMDMWEPFLKVVSKKAPQARVIFDRFHIVQHLNQGVDETRRDLVRELKGEARRALKNTKFPLYSRPRRIAPPKIGAYCGSRFKPIVRSIAPCCCGTTSWISTPTRARSGRRNFSVDGCQRAMRSKLDGMKRVAKMIRNHFDGVVGWVTWHLSNGRIEGTNNKIRLLSHRSYGLHSAESLISLIYLCCGGIELSRIH